MPRTKGSKNKLKTVTADFATQIAEKQSARDYQVRKVFYLWRKSIITRGMQSCPGEIVYGGAMFKRSNRL